MPPKATFSHPLDPFPWLHWPSWLSRTFKFDIFDRPVHSAPLSPGTHCASLPTPLPCILGTLSECLFFFGIYSSHFGGTRKGSRSSNFWRRQRHPFHPTRKNPPSGRGYLQPLALSPFPSVAPLCCVGAAIGAHTHPTPMTPPPAK